jgi:hypothetical protein
VSVVNDTNSSIACTGASWGRYTNRGFGDYQDDVQAATANGDSATVTFTGNGTGISLLTETNSDEGTIAVSPDGASQGSVNASSASRQVRQTVLPPVAPVAALMAKFRPRRGKPGGQLSVRSPLEPRDPPDARAVQPT